MASTSLYRKWRSQTLDEFVGQEHVVQTLRNAIIEERVGHAYLFTGPRGVGKTSMARLLSKAVNCTAERAARPCGICDSCQAVADGRAVDVIEMDAASHTSVDDAREMIERVQFRPTTGRYKVYIIDEVHMLSTAAFNALLKTLEEPPPHALFIMATTEVHKVPATILSRCQRFTFKRHTIADIVDHLERVASEEQMQLEAGVAEAIARAATGSMRDALGMLEQLGSFASGVLTLEQVQRLLGMTSAEEVQVLIQALLDQDLAAGLRAVQSVANQGADLRQFTRDLVDRLRSLMLLVATGDMALVAHRIDDQDSMAALADQAQAGELMLWIKLFSNLDYQLRLTPYGHLPLELAVVEAIVQPSAPVQTSAPVSRRQADTVSAPPRPRRVMESRAEAPVRPASRPPRPEATAPPAVEPAPRAAEPAPPSPRQAPPEAPGRPEQPAEPDAAADSAAMSLLEEVDDQEQQALARGLDDDLSLLERVESLWPHIVRDVGPYDKMVQALLRSVRPVDAEGDTLVLLAASPFHKSNLEQHQSRVVVEDIIQKHIGRALAIRCITEVQDGLPDRISQIREARKDPLVRAAINIFPVKDIDIESS
ncbi:MAG: DNA polymerase III subunit gamma/tau [Chloroflexaceae bacterium]|nr:DNA polymerase III subunit gamma/tau [Chloroflexaceae bacterium]